MQSPSIYQQRPRDGLSIEQEARRLARRVLQEWTASSSQDNKALEDGLQRAFMDEANHALRQVLFQLGARVELAMVKGHSAKGGLDERTASNIIEALARATEVVDVFLDRSRAVQYAISLRPEPFSLDEDVQDILGWNSFLDEPDALSLDLQPAPLVADRQRLRDVLGHLMARFWFSRLPGERLVVRVHPDPKGGVEGLVGLSRSHLHAVDLIEEIAESLSIQAVEIDIPYTRAVLQRHGGTLHVASEKNGTIGFGFRLPSQPPDNLQNEEDEHDGE